MRAKLKNVQNGIGVVIMQPKLLSKCECELIVYWRAYYVTAVVIASSNNDGTPAFGEGLRQVCPLKCFVKLLVMELQWLRNPTKQ